MQWQSSPRIASARLAKGSRTIRTRKAVEYSNMRMRLCCRGSDRVPVRACGDRPICAAYLRAARRPRPPPAPGQNHSTRPAEPSHDLFRLPVGEPLTGANGTSLRHDCSAHFFVVVCGTIRRGLFFRHIRGNSAGVVLDGTINCTAPCLKFGRREKPWEVDESLFPVRRDLLVRGGFDHLLAFKIGCFRGSLVVRFAPDRAGTQGRSYFHKLHKNNILRMELSRGRACSCGPLPIVGTYRQFAPTPFLGQAANGRSQSGRRV